MFDFFWPKVGEQTVARTKSTNGDVLYCAACFHGWSFHLVGTLPSMLALLRSVRQLKDKALTQPGRELFGSSVSWTQIRLGPWMPLGHIGCLSHTPLVYSCGWEKQNQSRSRSGFPRFTETLSAFKLQWRVQHLVFWGIPKKLQDLVWSHGVPHISAKNLKQTSQCPVPAVVGFE